jgi:hypothetical protein
VPRRRTSGALPAQKHLVKATPQDLPGRSGRRASQVARVSAEMRVANPNTHPSRRWPIPSRWIFPVQASLVGPLSQLPNDEAQAAFLPFWSVRLHR